MSRSPQRVTVAEYLDGPESLRRRELVFGMVREPPAPRFGHQTVVTRLAALMDAHVRERSLGRVCVAPVDVVLDREAALVVQPDVVFISRDRLTLVDDRIWGAPDFVVEVLSPGTARRDRTTKLVWYQRYGVGEGWLVDPQDWSVSVVDLTHPRTRPRRYAGGRRMQSRVLPEWDLPAARIFESGMADLRTTITCPACGMASQALMPADACQYFYECPACLTVLQPKPGDCCVFCSYGDRRCPWVQDGVPCPDADDRPAKA